MLYKLLTTLIVSLVSTTAFAEDFGEADWGATRDTVRQAENRPNRTPLDARDYLIYEASLPGVHRTRLVYQFRDDRLVAGRFLFSPKPNADTQAWIDQYQRVRDLITQQYGDPASEKAIPANPDLTLDRSEWAGALTADMLILKARWEMPGTEVLQQLAWRQQSPHHQVIYRPAGASAPPQDSTAPLF